MTQAAIFRLRLTDFRNFETLDLDLDARPVCLAGPNGSGKTNILEAISLLAPGRGLRGAESDEVLRRSAEATAPAWAVYAEALDAIGETASLASGLLEGARRETRLNGKPASRAAVAGLLPMIALLPEHDRLFAGPRADRLKFFDRLVTASEPSHGEALSAYEKLRSRRQRLLERGQADPHWLAALETDLAGHGVGLAAGRLAALSRLQAAIDAAADRVFPKADLALNGMVEAALADGAELRDAEDQLAKAFAEGRNRDAVSGRTLTAGPHRSDLTARHREKDQPAGRCSTGEQKALVIRLVLAQAQSLAGRGQRMPLLLLDEACAHLDAVRREGLAQAISALGAQAWLTGVEAGLFAAFGQEAQHLAVETGSVQVVA
ncbi:DNA replication/repair protein RecF [Hyphobacterium sp.]|uniref:DNA replication/repair protein RecF n=1 Tax=Hyphobacterium sp. TaxID=2004662 RepID=UPI003B51C253